jgi:phosphoenolpyruvate carboxykinase (GTP)
MASEKTAAAAGKVGDLRFDPFAMVPFCGYNMAEYFRHWLEVGKREGAQLPRIFQVNWFRKDPETGRFLWPGFSENSRVLAWVFGRVVGHSRAVETPIGLVPPTGKEGLDITGLDIAPDDIARVLEVDVGAYRQQLPQLKQHFAMFGDDLPRELDDQLMALEQRLMRAAA